MRKLLLFLLTALCLASCSVKRFVPADKYLLESVRVTCDDASLRASAFNGYLRQRPNSKWFSLVKVPMAPYLLQGRDSAHWSNRFLRRVGEAPVIYDPTATEQTVGLITQALRNMGYMHPSVTVGERTRRHKMHVTYDVSPGERLYVRSIKYVFPNGDMERLYDKSVALSELHVGVPFDVNTLDRERSRVTTLFNNNGYLRFNRSFVRYLADTLEVPGTVALTLQVLPYRPTALSDTSAHIAYRFDSIYYDSLAMATLRRSVLRDANLMRRGSLYSEQALVGTYANLNRLGNVLNCSARPVPRDSCLLDEELRVSFAPRHSIQFSPEATNTAGDLGAAISLTYQDRNIFHGGETFSVKLRGAYEAIKGLKGYADKGYTEYNAEASLDFPSFKFPFLRNSVLSRTATTQVALMYGSQDRPEFHRRVLTAALRYRWSNYRGRMQHRFDLLDLNYIYMPWISETFRHDYLDDATNRNAILRYNYEPIFIMKMGYTYSYASRTNIRDTNIQRSSRYSVRFSVETAGNLLQLFAAAAGTAKHADGYHHFLGNAYAQYARAEIDYSRTQLLDSRTSIAFHTYLGVACPYGNSTILPYERRFFSGGANSVRGWSVRSLGPGRFRGTDGRIDFINQTGDMKLDLSLELRSRLFWKLHGAIFVDAGNIWTLRDYPDQPGGQFRFDSFHRQIAVAYGVGLRFDFDYFVVRFDGAMKAVDPSRPHSALHYPIAHPRFSRDFAFHFAVGLPF